MSVAKIHETVEMHFPIIKLNIITKKEVKHYIKKFLDRKVKIIGSLEEQYKGKDQLAEVICEFYKLPKGKRKQQIKINKRKRILQRSDGICEVKACNNPVYLGQELHHIIPENLGGSRKDENLVLVCERCHNEINKFQRKCQEEVCKGLFESATEIPINDNRQADIMRKIDELQKSFFEKFEFKIK